MKCSAFALVQYLNNTASRIVCLLNLVSVTGASGLRYFQINPQRKRKNEEDKKFQSQMKVLQSNDEGFLKIESRKKMLMGALTKDP